MSTGYVIYQVLSGTEKPAAHFVSVVWEQEAAEEIVRRLNALGPEDFAGYVWKEIWIHPRPEKPESGYLTAKDRELLLLARAHEALGTERPIGVFFSFPFKKEAAIAAYRELQQLGWPDVGLDEELTGDDLWHVYAHHRRMDLTGEAVAQLRADMERIAENHGGEFDGWNVSGGNGLQSELGKLPK